ncbi:MAG: polysaccharide deacetylase family protein [Patescibacteria group bacterium]
MKRKVGAVFLMTALLARTIHAEALPVEIEISPRGSPVVILDRSSVSGAAVAKFGWSSELKGSEFIVETKPRLDSLTPWGWYDFVPRWNDLTRRSVPFVDPAQTYARILELPMVGIASNVGWKLTLWNLATGLPLDSNIVRQCTAHCYFTEKPDMIITNNQWFNPINVTYLSPGRKELRAVVDGPGILVEKKWAVVVTNADVSILQNGGFEESPTNTPPGWIRGGYGSSTRLHALVAGRSGQWAGQVTISNWNGNSDARWQPMDTAVVAGGIYRYSFWYKSTGQTNNLTLYRVFTNGTVDFVGAGLYPASPEWTYEEVTVVVPTNAVTISPYVALVGNGTLVVDDARLVKFADTAMLDGGCVTFFMDDAWKVSGNVLTNILETNGYRGCFAIPSDRPGSNPAYYTWSDLRGLKIRGHSLVAHGTDHSSLTNVPTTEMIRQLNWSLVAMRSNGVPAQVLVYPFGGRNGRTDLEAAEAGYVGCVGTDSGYNVKSLTNPLNVKRMTIYSSNTVAEVKEWMDYANAHKVWLMVAWHHVGDGDTSDYSWPAAWVAEVVAYARTKGLLGVSVEQGLDLVR